MKKFLSIILACAMIMSLFCVVPASAAVSAGPYWVEDFETGSDSALFNSGKAGTIVPGDNGSKYMVKKSVTAPAGLTAKVPGQSVSNGVNGITDIEFAATENVVGSIKPGETVTITFKYKLLYPVAAGSMFSIHFSQKLVAQDGTVGSTTYPTAAYTIANPADTANWQTATMEYKVPDNAYTYVEGETNPGFTTTLLYIRWGKTTSGNNLADVPAEAVEVGYYYDDVVVTRKVDQGDPDEIIFDGSQALVQGGTGPATLVNGVDDPYSEGDNVVYETTYNGTNQNADNLGMVFANFGSKNIVLNAGDTVNFSFKLAAAGVKEVEYTDGNAYSDYSSLRFYNKEASEGADAPASATNINTWDKTQFKFHLNTEGWQEFNFSYTFEPHSYTTSAGATVQVPNGIDFKSVRLYIANIGKVGKYGLQDATVYLDDIKITVTHAGAVSKTPVVTGLAATVNNDGEVTADYTFTKGAGDATEGTEASVYNLKNASGAIVSSGFVADGITVPAGIENTQLEIVPITSAGYIGAPVTCAVAKEFNVSTELLSTDFMNDEFTVSYSLKNSLRTGENVHVFSIIVAYDSLGEIIDYDELYILSPNVDPSAPAVTGTHTLEVGTGNLANTGDVHYVKAFLWEAESDQSNVTMKEFAPMLTATEE